MEEGKQDAADDRQAQGTSQGASHDVVKLQARLAELEGERAQRLKADEDAKSAEKERLKKAGDYEKLIEQQNADLAAAREKLAALEGDATIGKGFRERETARIDAAKKDLTESQRKLIDAQSSIDLKSALLDELLSKKGAALVNPGAPGGSPPANGGSTVEQLLAAGWNPREIKAKHPTEFSAWAQKRASASPQPATGIAALFRRST